MTIPNAISIFRIFLVPVFLILVVNGHFFAALVIFITAGISDGADGMIARLFDQKSRLGSYLDPLADKCLLVGSFICLALIDIVPFWLTAIIITRDVLILVGVSILFIKKGAFVINPSIWGKATTFFQLATIFLVLIEKQFELPADYVPVLYGATGALTVSSGIVYIKSWFMILKGRVPLSRSAA